MISETIKARRGDSTLEKYGLLTKFLDGQALMSGDDRVIVTQTGKGQEVVLAQPRPSIVTPLQVSLSGSDRFRVSEGYVNGRLPMVKTDQGEEPVVDEDGVPHAPARLPTTRPIVVVAEVTFKDDLAFDKVVITTRPPGEIKRLGSADISEKGKLKGHIPLAFLRGARFVQFTLHNLQARAYRRLGTARILYWPA
jgi:hypothetical protein